MQRFIGRLGGIGILLVALLTPSAVALADSGTSRYVKPAGGVAGCPAPAGKTYNTIQEAVTAAGKGDTIFVCPGTYQESVQVDGKTKLTIRNYVVTNQPPPTIDPGAANLAILVNNSSEVTIQGLHMSNAEAGVYVMASPKTIVQNCLMDTSVVGIFFNVQSPKSRALRNTITNVEVAGIQPWADESVVEDNTVNNTERDGIVLIGASGITVRRNLLINNHRYGILLAEATNITISDNTINFNTEDGINVGIRVFKSTIKNNTLRGNSTGIFIDSTLTGNTYSKNSIQWSTANDVEDTSTGSTTAGTANTWKENTCDVSAPAGLCAAPATGP